MCELYNTQIRRGAAWSKSNSFRTTSLWGHVKAKHEKEAAEAKALQDKRAKKRKLEEEKKSVYRITTLSKLARSYLAPPASSTISEREFKVAKSIQTASRTRLLPKNFEMLLFLKYNLRAVSYRTEVCSPPKEFHPPQLHYV